MDGGCVKQNEKRLEECTVRHKIAILIKYGLRATLLKNVVFRCK